MRPAVTVLMAVFDTPRAMLSQAVDSILRQTYRDFEFLILDDGSSDLETRAVLLSIRGGDYELTVGQDLSIGYAIHDRTDVELYLTESFTFRVLEEKAAIFLRRAAATTAPAARKSRVSGR